jgi:N-acetylmuramoyl-L-alanine amidase
LAVAAQALQGADALRLIAIAADLRERVWRRDGRQPDLLEAIELQHQAQRIEGPEQCHHALQEAALRSESTADLSQLYEQVYLIRGRFRDDAKCVEQVDQTLTTVAAYKPPADRLAALDDEARKLRGDNESSSGAAAASASVTSRVVTPGGAPGSRAPEMTGPSKITHIERYPGKDAARVVVFLTTPASFTAGQVAPNAAGKDGRLFVDIRQSKYTGPKEFNLGGIVERVRIGQQQDAMRVVLDLSDSVLDQVFYLPEPFRLVIDVSRKGTQASKPEPNNEGPGKPEEGKPGRKDREIQRVVLDPGHGGHDPGATGPSGLREKDVVLDIAHRAAPLIARELGISTLLTRDVDAYVPLDERVARANAFAADLFISIHCNASETHGGRGVMTFVLDAAADANASAVAARENAASLAASTEFATTMSRFLDAHVSAASVHFAGLVQKASLAALLPKYSDVRDEGVHRAGFYVLAGARMPAVLVETSFISNPNDEQRLNMPDYRQKLADGLVNAVRAYREGL